MSSYPPSMKPYITLRLMSNPGKNRILVTGANGQLGMELRDLSATFPDYEFTFFGKDDFSIVDGDAAEKIMVNLAPQFLINCAAYTAVDKAEHERQLAYSSNALAVGLLAELCSRHHCKFIHISTDYVFNGVASSPLNESHPVAPVNYYGETKLAGEKLALEKNPGSVIIRTAWVYSAHGKNFVKTMLRLMKEKPEISVVSDQQGTPTYAADLAQAIMHIISSGPWIPGVYHYSNEGQTTWFSFASRIKELAGLECQIHPISTAQFPTPAKRPAYSVLDKSKIKETYALSIRDWETALRACLLALKN
jgi:dTDP-4-dehydrorhamnose reductase